MVKAHITRSARTAGGPQHCDAQAACGRAIGACGPSEEARATISRGRFLSLAFAWKAACEPALSFRRQAQDHYASVRLRLLARDQRGVSRLVPPGL